MAARNGACEVRVLCKVGYTGTSRPRALRGPVTVRKCPFKVKDETFTLPEICCVQVPAPQPDIACGAPSARSLMKPPMNVSPSPIVVGELVVIS